MTNNGRNFDYDKRNFFMVVCVIVSLYRLIIRNDDFIFNGKDAINILNKPGPS